MKNWLFILVACTQVSAGIVEFKGTPKTITASGTTVKVLPEAIIKDGADFNTKLSGFGIRKKTVFFVNVNVYVAASYMDDLSNVQKESPLESIKNTKARVMQLTFLRSLSGAELSAAMQESLTIKGNDVDITSAAFQNLFNEFNFDLNAGDSITLAMYNKGGNLEKVLIEVPEKKFSQEANFFGLDLWKGWFGVPVDSGMKELQPQLLSNK